MKTVWVDMLILGGGIQGCMLLRQLSPDYSTLLLAGDAQDSETLHFHGYFSSGWNAANPQAAEIYLRTARRWYQWLTNAGLDARQTPFYSALVPELAAELEKTWAATGLPVTELSLPPIFDSSTFPPHRSFQFRDDLIFDGAAVLDYLQKPLTERILPGKALSFERSGSRVKAVIAELDGQQVRIEPQFVVACCGAGNARILQQLSVDTESICRAQMVRPLHMILARGPGQPKQTCVSAFLFDLVLIQHPLENGEQLWIFTLNPQRPAFTTGPIDMARPPAIEPDLVRASLRKVAAAMPGFTQLAQGCEWSVYAGWKADAPGPDSAALLNLEYPCPYHCEQFGMENFIAVWPNHWCLALPAAEATVGKIQKMINGKYTQPALNFSAQPKACNKWQRDGLRWRDWRSFSAEYQTNME